MAHQGQAMGVRGSITGEMRQDWGFGRQGGGAGLGLTGKKSLHHVKSNFVRERGG